MRARRPIIVLTGGPGGGKSGCTATSCLDAASPRPFLRPRPSTRRMRKGSSARLDVTASTDAGTASIPARGCDCRYHRNPRPAASDGCRMVAGHSLREVVDGAPGSLPPEVEAQRPANPRGCGSGAHRPGRPCPGRNVRRDLRYPDRRSREALRPNHPRPDRGGRLPRWRTRCGRGEAHGPGRSGPGCRDERLRYRARGGSGTARRSGHPCPDRRVRQTRRCTPRLR